MAYGFDLVPLATLAVLAVMIGALAAPAFFLARKRRLAFLGGYVILLLGLLVYPTVVYFHPFGPVDRLRIIAQTATPEGAQFVLTKSRNEGFLGGGEPYTVAFWFKTPGGPWHWCYVDHEGTYWWGGRIETDSKANQIKAIRGDTTVLTMDLKSFRYGLNGQTMNRDAIKSRVLGNRAKAANSRKPWIKASGRGTPKSRMNYYCARSHSISDRI